MRLDGVLGARSGLGSGVFQGDGPSVIFSLTSIEQERGTKKGASTECAPDRFDHPAHSTTQFGSEALFHTSSAVGARASASTQNSTTSSRT